MANHKRGGLTVAAFFGRRLKGASLSDAFRGAGIAYSTVLRARDKPAECRRETFDALEKWSRTVDAARDAGVWIDAAATQGYGAREAS